MRKSFFFLALGAMAFTACTSEEVVDVGIQKNPIGFENAVMKQSRADDAPVSGDLNNDTFDKFLVYGYYTMKDQANNPVQVFSGEPVTKVGNAWTYNNTRFWVPDARYCFFAYSCGDIALNNIYGTVGLSLNVGESDRQMTISSFRCDSKHNHDLIVAQKRNMVGLAITSENPTPNDNVSLKFSHVLTKVDATFISEFDDEYDVVIKNVQIENFRNIGAFKTDGEMGTWSAERESNVTDHSTIILPFANGEGVANKAGADRQERRAQTGSVYMIPYKYEHNDVQITFSIDLYKGTDHTPANLVMGRNMKGTWSPNWEVGKYYTYNIRLTGSLANLQPIVFETAEDLNGWSSSSSTATDISFSAN